MLRFVPRRPGPREQVRGGALTKSRAAHDRGYTVALLAEMDHNITRAAQVANLSRRAVHDRLERLGISVR